MSRQVIRGTRSTEALILPHWRMAMNVQQFLASAEARCVLTTRANLLLEVAPPLQDDVVAALLPVLPGPVRALASWPIVEDAPWRGAVILRGVEALPIDQQRAMLAWVKRTRGEVQTISLTARPLFELVVRGDFLFDLYYHLNTIHLTLDAGV